MRDYRHKSDKKKHFTKDKSLVITMIESLTKKKRKLSFFRKKIYISENSVEITLKQVSILEIYLQCDFREIYDVLAVIPSKNSQRRASGVSITY